jgi:OB-fold nucleic acid binding domain
MAPAGPRPAEANTPAGGAQRKEYLSWEKELLGIYVSEHPLQEVAARMGDVVTAYLAELKEEEDGDLVTVACVVTSARKHITKEKKLMMFAQVEDLTGSVEVTIFPRTYEATAAVWNTDEILLVLGRVEKRDEAPKILVEHAVPFNDQGIRDIKRIAAETAERLAKRAKFIRPVAAAGPAAGGPSPRPPRPLTSTNGNGGDEGSSPAGLTKPTELVIRFREALDYERSIAIFQRIQQVLKDFAGGATVVLELPRASGGARRVPTSFKTSVSADVAEAVEREVGRDVVEVVLPQR